MSSFTTDKQIKNFIREKIPLAPKLYHKIRKSLDDYKMSKSFRGLTKDKVFQTLYEWNLSNKIESVSGPGSTLEITKLIRSEIKKLIINYKIKTLIDIPCGDFNWMKEVELNLDQYIGADIVRDLIEINSQKYGNNNRKFIQLDITKDKLPLNVDLILCRDLLVHFSFEDITKAIKSIKNSRSKYLLTTCHNNVNNKNIVTGLWRPLNLQKPPYNFPDPVESISEDDINHYGKRLALYCINDIN